MLYAKCANPADARVTRFRETASPQKFYLRLPKYFGAQTSCQGRKSTSSWKGDSYFSEILNFTMGIPTSCLILFTGFRTVFVFALGRFVPMVVNFFD